METRNIINFYELDEKWQVEAISNLGEIAEENHYLEPDETATPEKHILWDLNECMLHKGTHDGFQYNAVIGISNNSAMLLNIDNAFETATIKIV